MQTLIAIMIGIVALIYIIQKIVDQLSHSEVNPKCENCPIPDLYKYKK